jgi:DNA-binding transcriptional ArsR family regulator
VAIGPRKPLLLVPSVYVWPHVRVNCDAPWPLAVVYRAPHLVAGLHRSTPPQLVQLLKALADPTRLRILELVAAQPRSTQELAPLVGLTDAGASKQLRQLAAAGLLSTRREGYYVVYSLEPEKLATLSAELGHLVGGTR